MRHKQTHSSADPSPQPYAEALYKILLENPAIGFWLTDENGRFLEVNDAYQQRAGYSHQEMLAMGIADVEACLTPAEIAAQMAKAKQQGTLLFESQHQTKTGEIWPVELNVTYKNGRYLTLIQDITTRRQQRRAIYLMAETQQQIARLDNLQDLYQLVGKKIQELLEVSYTITTMLDESIQAMRVIGVYGFGSKYETLVRRFNVDPTRMTYALDDMTPEELRVFRSGRLEKFEDGLYALLTRKVPRRICEVTEKQLHISAIYTMGFIWKDRHYGGLIILAKQDIAPFKKMIETIMNQAAIAIKRIRSEQALRESEEKLQLFIEHAPASLAMFDREMRYLAVSQRWLRDYSLGKQDIIGHSHYEIFPEVPDRWKGIHQRALAGEVITANEDAFPRLDGHVQWLRWEVRPWYTVDGSIGGIVIFSEDITARKETEGALADLQHILASAESIAKMGSWKWDLETQKITWSDEMFTLFGVDRETFDGDLNKIISIRIHPDDLPKVQQSNQSVLDQQMPIPLEYRIVLPSGEERVVWAEGQLFHDQENRPVALVGYVQDITERKKAEKALRESEARYHRTLENMLEGCQIIGFDWRYLYVNASVFAHARRSKDSLLGQTMMEAYPGIENTKMFAILRRCMRQRTAHRMENQFFYDDGSYAWFDLSIQPIPEGLFILSVDITERKQAEEALRQSEERFSKAFHLSPAALSLTRENGRILDVNESFERLSGYSRAELIDQDATKLGLFTPAQRADLRRRLTAEGSGQRKAELTVRRKTGEMRNVLSSIEMIDIDGEACALTLAVDITERKQAEIALKEMADNMATAQQMTHSGSWEVNLTPDLAFIDPQIWSDECYRILGVEPGSISITEEYFYTLVHPDDRAAAREALRQVIHSGREANYDYRLIRPDGSVRTLHDRVKVVVDEESGRPVKLVGIVQDITERKEAEATITRLNRRMELILNSAGEGIYGTDINGRIIFVNPAMARMTGWEPNDLLGQAAHAIFHHSRHDGSPHPAADCNILIAIREEREYHTDEDFYWRKDGSSFPVDFTSTPIWEDDQVTGMVVVVKDITERKQAEAEQAQLEAQLRQAQKMESIGRLAGGVAHDFNNQLTIIQIYSELIRGQMTAGDPLIPKVEQIRQATQQAAGLTRQLLAFSRKQMLQPVVLNLNELVANLEKMLGRLIGEDIIFSTVLQPGLWSVTADPSQMEQVIMNLVVNARDAMPTGGMVTIETKNLVIDGAVRLTHLDAPSGPCVMLSVTDTGHGMEAKTQAQIFEPFFTTKERGKGTGLGLATVYGIIKQSAGAIYVYSEPEEGTTFKIYLPVNKEAVGSYFDADSAEQLRRGTETILLVEDEESLRDLVRDTLEDLGYMVLAAETPQQAFKLADQHKGAMDLLLTDVVMPQISGQRLAQELVALYPQVKVLFMSGYTDDAIVRHGLLTSEVAFLPKPFSRDVLAAKVRQVLDKET